MKTIMLVNGKKIDTDLHDEYPNPCVPSGVYHNKHDDTIEITREYTIDDLRSQIKACGVKVTVKDEHAYLTMTMLRGIINASEAYGVSIVLSLWGDIAYQNAKDLAHNILLTLPHD